MKPTFLFLLSLSISISHSQSLTGMSGLYTIPNAETMDDGTVLFGTYYLPKEFMNGTEDNQYDGLIVCGSISFLPGMELGLRITHILSKQENYLGDRMIFAKYRFLSESEYIPSVLIGIHDFLGPGGGIKAQHFNSLYFIATKNIPGLLFFDNIQLNAGYGSDIIEAGGHQFVGLFGGISLDFNFPALSFVEGSLLGEYDAERFNAGMRVTLFEHVKIIAGLMDLKYFSGGISYQFKL